MTPERVGRYRIVRELGRGGFATVYLGEDPGLDDLVAIKILSETLAADADGVARFVSEARVMRNLREPGVVTVHDVGEHDGLPYFVMEYCSRGALADRLESLDRPLTIAEGLGLAKAIGEAVGGMHQASPPVVHRDIKPANLLIRHRPNRVAAPVGDLLGGDEELIVGDFGLAKVVDPTDTKFTLIAYTRGFAPPEQLRGDGAIGPTADVFSASAVVAAAVSGVAPSQMFADGDEVFDPDVLASTGPLAGELARGLSYDRNRRHATIGAWTDSLIAATAAPSAPSEASSTARTTIAPPTPPSGHPADGAGPSSGPPPAAPPSATPSPGMPSPAVPRPATPPPVVPPSAPQTVNAAAPPSPTPSSPDTSGSAVGPAQANGPKRGLFIGLGTMAAGLLAVVAGLGLVFSGDDGLIGPSEARVGDQVAFAVDEGFEPTLWRVDGQAFDAGSVLEFMTTGAGSVDIEAVDGDGAERSATLQVSADDSELRIVGPAVLPLDATTTLTAQGTGEQVPRWVIDGETLVQETLELRPASVGSIEIELRGRGGDAVTRTFTVPPSG